MITSPSENDALQRAARAAQVAQQAQDGQSDAWTRYLDALKMFTADPVPLEIQGMLVRVAGLVLESAGLREPVGSVCEVHMSGQPPVQAEVVGFSGDRTYLMPTGNVHGLASGARVVPKASPTVPLLLGAARHPWRRSLDRTLHLPVGDGLLGRVIDSQGHPMDRKGPLTGVHDEPLVRRPINAMDRDPVRRPLDTGVRAINSMLTVGRGQRLGLFAGTGVGKSVLMGMMARYTEADVIVVGLIGERGREVKEFIEDILGADGLARSVVVAAPADSPPLTRMQGANYATAIAEHFRDRGQHVLLLMDSLTRYAMA
ncbi:MAG: flagellum-specific ATP synthase FliI, partial [Rhizobacter sp.]|nr:flagellum-specific ATP synthase FliI [Rhizobacter sp.]